MKKSIFLIIAILLLPPIIATSYTQTAADVSPGVFADGNYFFPSTLNVGTDTAVVSGPALYLGDDAGNQWGIYYNGDSYYFPIAITSTSSSSSTYGVYSNVDNGIALYGKSASTSTSKAGVYGYATGGAPAVYGYDSSGSGIGVKAYSSHYGFYASGADYGLYIPHADSYGVYVASSDTTGGKFVGDSYGIYAHGGTAGVYGMSDTIGVYGVSDSSSSHQCGLSGYNTEGGNLGYVGCYDYGLYTPNNAKVDGSIRVGSCSGCDIAEHFIGEDLEPGDVVVLDPTSANHVRKTTTAYDKLAAGIISTEPTITMGLSEGVPVALSGVVPTKVIGIIHLGDLLTTSSTPGYAMACTDYELCAGAIIGKAMEENTNSKGMITVLVMLG